MFKSSVLFSLIPLLLSSVQATPIISQDLSNRQVDPRPSINVIFFSDNNCTTTVPATDYTRKIYDSCYTYGAENWQSLLIDEIDDRFIGTNTALEVGSTAGNDPRDFTYSLKYSIATREQVGKCQFIGIPSGPGKPLRGGNEYRLTNLE